MKKISKRFAAWVTVLRSNIFVWARISITALYLLIILGVLSVYSVAMYFSLLKNIEHQITVANSTIVNDQMRDHAIDNLQLKIFLIDIGTLIVAAAGSYWLAGITLRPIRRVLEAQEAFSADASHELRTPLAVMKTDIEVLLRGNTPLPAEAVSVLNSNLEEITLLSNMTTELLELSRGRHTIHEPVNIHAIVSEEVEKMQTLAHQKNIALSLQKDSSTRMFNGDRQTIARVIKNIIANAITYTVQNGSVRVSSQDKEDTIIVTVLDTGIGIAENDLPHIFDRFYKADSARRENTTGSGLGLAIAKQIVEYYGGSITIQSTVAVGTAVTITLPYR